MMVMMTANTPSLKASMRPFVIIHTPWFRNTSLRRRSCSDLIWTQEFLSSTFPMRPALLQTSPDSSLLSSSRPGGTRSSLPSALPVSASGQFDYLASTTVPHRDRAALHSTGHCQSLPADRWHRRLRHRLFQYFLYICNLT